MDPLPSSLFTPLELEHLTHVDDEAEPEAAAGEVVTPAPYVAPPIDFPPTPLVPAPGLGAASPGAPHPLDSLRSSLQAIAGPLLADQAYWEMLKRTAAPRTFLEFIRFAYAADAVDGANKGGNNQQVIIQAPFPRGPLDVLPAHMRIE